MSEHKPDEPRRDPCDRLLSSFVQMIDALAGMGIRSPDRLVLQSEDDWSVLQSYIDLKYHHLMVETGRPRPFTIMGIEIHPKVPT